MSKKEYSGFMSQEITHGFHTENPITHKVCFLCEESDALKREKWAKALVAEADYANGLYFDLKKLGAPVGYSMVKRLKKLAKEIREG